MGYLGNGLPYRNGYLEDFDFTYVPELQHVEVRISMTDHDDGSDDQLVHVWGVNLDLNLAYDLLGKLSTAVAQAEFAAEWDD